MEGCFMFQWGELFFRWEGASFLSGGVPHRGIGFGGGGGLERNRKMPPQLWKTLSSILVLIF